MTLRVFWDVDYEFYKSFAIRITIVGVMAIVWSKMTISLQWLLVP